MYAITSIESVVCLMVLLRRLLLRHPRLAISAYNMNRLLIALVMIATEFSEYGYYSDAYYSRVDGIEWFEDFDTLEREMMMFSDNVVNVNGVIERYVGRQAKVVSAVHVNLS